MSDLFITQEQYDAMTERLILAVDADGYKFDSLLCLARGGLRIGDVFSRVHGNFPLCIMATSSYRADAGKTQGELTIAGTYTATQGAELKGRVLLLDDMVDSGKTLAKTIVYLKEKYPAVTEIRVAVLWWKSHSVYKPDYYIDYLEDNPWIHQPFERYDDVCVEDLKKAHADR